MSNENQPPKTNEETSLAKSINKPALKPIQKIEEVLSVYEKDMLPALLKKHNLDPDTFKYRVLNQIKQNDDLIRAYQENPASLFACIMAAAEVGLAPTAGEFFLIPRKVNNKLTVCPQIGYLGLVKILLRSGKIDAVHTRCVFEGDNFKIMYGSEETLYHEPNLDAPQNTNTLKFVYATAFLKNGRHQFTVLSKDQLLKLKALSKYDNHLYFNDAKDPEFWMLRKTALIQLSKLLPKDLFSSEAIDMANKIEGGAVFTLDEDGKMKMIDANVMPTMSSRKKNMGQFLDGIPEFDQ
jgi:recombination protein RecT